MGSALAVLSLAGSAAAQDIAPCPILTDLLDAAASGTTPDAPQGAEQCATSLALSGSRAVYCRWAFDYRAPAATEVMERMRDAVVACLPEARALPGDLSVNHPDGYVLHSFEVGTRTLAISLKDKGGLGRTYVFVRAEASSSG